MSTVLQPPSQLLTAEEFYDFCHRPENRDRHFELEQGEVVEMPGPGGRHGVVCANAVSILRAFVRQRRRGHVCSNDTGVIWGRTPDTVRGPDVILFDESRRYEDMEIKYIERVPAVVVEVLSPSDRWAKVVRRISQFLQKGVAIVWVIDPEDRTVTVFEPNQYPRVLEESDEIEGFAILPEFRCKVAEFFQTNGE